MRRLHGVAIDKRRKATQAALMGLGPAIRDARSAAGLSQLALADRAELLDQPAISHWENGTRIPSLEELSALEGALELSRGALLLAAGFVETVGVEMAIAGDPNLDSLHRELLVETYRSHVRRVRKRRQSGDDGTS
jgi:HTH-type transcriptional regulator, cell division transcriptional repressor